jgi:hypothetical protein
MPKFVNRNAHTIRVREKDGQPLTRVVPGQVVEASGAFADALKGTNGVETASDADQKTWEAQSTPEEYGETPELLQHQPIAPLLNEARKRNVSDPLQVVIGDDEAPLGPPTGEVAHRDDVAEADPLATLAVAGSPAIAPTSASIVEAQIAKGGRRASSEAKAEDSLTAPGPGGNPQAEVAEAARKEAADKPSSGPVTTADAPTK